MQRKESSVFVEADFIPLKPVGEGIERRILGYDGDLMMTYVTFTKGAIGAVHRHVHRQVTYIESGSFEVRIGAGKKVLKAHDCYFVPSNTDHGVVALEKGSLVDVFSPARADFLGEKE